MERQILHVDVNNAFLSWLAIYKLESGEKDEAQEQRYSTVDGSGACYGLVMFDCSIWNWTGKGR